MFGSLSGKRALVCGSTQGIGKAVAEALAHAGAGVVLMARNAERLEAVRLGLPAAVLEHRVVVADFSVPGAPAAALSHWDFEREPIHMLINNTGGPAPGPVHTADPEAFRAAFEMHVLAAHGLMQALLPGMRASGYGRVVNIISTSVKQPLPGLGVSNTVRAAMGNWCKTLATELAPWGITVNNVLPGATATERLVGIVQNRAAKSGASPDDVEREMRAEIPLGRFAEPSEIAAAVAFLCSPAAAYITGINLPVDGGRTASL
ncbi:SDR family oxidoreductase [bacterium]|nr:SDR family oxidoreductase [bacterium]